MSVISEKPIIDKDQQDSNGNETLENSLSQCSKLHQMYSTDNSLYEAIPATAVPIKVINMQSPYVMRAYEIEKYCEKLDNINKELLSFVNSNNFLKKKGDAQDPKIGDMILTQSNNAQEHTIELPSFICRGIITYIKNTVYNVLFVDYGMSFKLSRDQFSIVPCDFILNRYLTKTIGIYNVLPVCVKQDTSNDHKSMTAVAEEKWSNKAIQFAKDLLIASQAVYFDHLLIDEKNNREYGEFYLIIDNIIVSLSEALIIDYHATYLKGDLLQLVKNSNNIQHKEEQVIINAKFSTDRINRYRAILNGFDGHNSFKKFCQSEKVLIYNIEKCEILSNVNDLGFSPEIHLAWEKCIKSSRPKKLQSYIWPAIKKGLDIVAIGSLQSGKTSACIMAICGLVIMRQKELPRSATHPLALILCSSSFEVINIQSLCTSFLSNFKNTKFVAALNSKTNRSIATAIYNGCQILITTPRYLVRFLNENPGLLSFDKLFYLVFDNADIILDKYYNSIGELFKKHNIIENRESQADDRPLLQIIITATYCTPQIKKFARLVMYNPCICITSFIEAIVFKSVRPRMYVLKSTWKNKKISDLLKDDYMMLKTMVVCTNTAEAEELNAFLLSMTKKTLLIHEKMKPTDMQDLQESWRACVYGLYSILICTDAVLSELNFTDIQWLIHHSVLLKFKNQFNYRFSVLLDNLLQDIATCKVSIIIDESNNVQFQSILKMMMRMRVVISSVKLQKDIERMEITLERNKKDYAICDKVKAFGFCQERNICMFRHCMLPEIDESMMDIQANDKLKFIIMHVHNASHFSARVIEHIPHSDKSKKIMFSNVEYMQTTIKLQEYYRSIKNRKMCTSTDVGNVCILEESVDIFKRVQIRCIRYDCSEEIKFVDVRCIDSGIIYRYVDARKLIYLPDKLSKLPTHIVEVFLADIAPCDEEYIWNQHSNNAVHEWLSKNFNPKSYIIGKVRLHLGNTIWLDDLEIGTKLIGYGDLIDSSLKKHLISGNHAVLNKNHMSQLLTLQEQRINEH